MPEITVRDRFGYWKIVGNTPGEIQEYHPGQSVLNFMPTSREIAMHNCEIAFTVSGDHHCTCGHHKT